MAESKPKTLVEKLAAISGEIGPIGKEDENSALKFKFRSIDRIMAKSTPLFAKYGIVILPEVQHFNIESRETNKGNYIQVAYICEMLIKYTFVCGEERESVLVPSFAIDYSDKCAAQAMTAAYKVAILQVLGISSGEDQDYDNNSVQTPQAKPEQKKNELNWQSIDLASFTHVMLDARKWDGKFHKIKSGKGKGTQYIIINDRDGNKNVAIRVGAEKIAIAQEYLDFLKKEHAVNSRTEIGK